MKTTCEHLSVGVRDGRLNTIHGPIVITKPKRPVPKIVRDVTDAFIEKYREALERLA